MENFRDAELKKWLAEGYENKPKRWKKSCFQME